MKRLRTHLLCPRLRLGKKLVPGAPSVRAEKPEGGGGGAAKPLAHFFFSVLVKVSFLFSSCPNISNFRALNNSPLLFSLFPRQVWRPAGLCPSMAPGLLQPPHHPVPSALRRARPGEAQSQSTATSLDLGAQAPEATEAAPSPDGSRPVFHPNFPPRALGACPAPGLEVHSPEAVKGQGREESARRPVAALRASPQPRVTLKAPSRVRVRAPRLWRAGSPRWAGGGS